MQSTSYLPLTLALGSLLFGACASSDPFMESLPSSPPSMVQDTVGAEPPSDLDTLAVQLLNEPVNRASGLKIGLLIEATAEFTEADRLSVPSELDRFNKVRMRSVELGVTSAIGELGTAHVAIDMADGGAGSDFILREAFAWMGEKQGGLSYRAGKYFADIGAWNRVYPSSFPSPNLDGVRRKFLGGNLATTGVEIHGGNSADGFRWSTGIATNVERQNADFPGNGTGTSVPLNRVGLQSWGASGRLQWGKPDSLQVGTSAWFSPGEIWTEEGTTLELKTALWDLDLITPFLGGELSGEFWMKEGETSDSAGQESATAMGYWGTWNRDLGPNWTLGFLGSHWEHFSTDENTGHYYSGSLGYRLGESQRLRLSLSHDNPGFGWQKFYAVGFQWILNPTLFTDKK